MQKLIGEIATAFRKRLPQFSSPKDENFAMTDRQKKPKESETPSLRTAHLKPDNARESTDQ